MIDRKSVKIEPHTVLVDTEDNYYWTYIMRGGDIGIYQICIYSKGIDDGWRIDNNSDELTLKYMGFFKKDAIIKKIIKQPIDVFLSSPEWRDTFYRKVFEQETLKAIQSLKEKGML